MEYYLLLATKGLNLYYRCEGVAVVNSIASNYALEFTRATPPYKLCNCLGTYFSSVFLRYPGLRGYLLQDWLTELTRYFKTVEIIVLDFN